MRINKYLIIIILIILAGIIVEFAKSEITVNKKQQENRQLKTTFLKNQINREATSIIVQPSVTFQGDTIFVRANSEGWIEFNQVKYQLQPLKHDYVALIPIPLDQVPGIFKIVWYPLETMVIGNITASQETKEIQIIVNKKEFSTQYLKVTKEQQKMVYNDQKIKEDREKYTNAISQPMETPLFSGEFIQPVDGRTTTMYGYTRYINGVLDSRHLAIDLAAPLGTPILAPNNGKVVLATELYLSGNRVIIDHGGNLHTSFSHLSKLNVSYGDYVNKGDIIGWVGSTGFSTGPHLHHAVYVQGYPVNPEQFFGTNPYIW